MSVLIKILVITSIVTSIIGLIYSIAGVLTEEEFLDDTGNVLWKAGIASAVIAILLLLRSMV